MPTTIPDEDWELVQLLTERIMHRAYEQEDDIKNLNNLLHVLHGEGVRNRQHTKTGKPQVFSEGKWVDR